jgi:hypothetical protein
VAVKVIRVSCPIHLPSKDPSAREAAVNAELARHEYESWLNANLRHPNIVQLFTSFSVAIASDEGLPVAAQGAMGRDWGAEVNMDRGTSKVQHQHHHEQACSCAVLDQRHAEGRLCGQVCIGEQGSAVGAAEVHCKYAQDGNQADTREAHIGHSCACRQDSTAACLPYPPEETTGTAVASLASCCQCVADLVAHPLTLPEVECPLELTLPEGSLPLGATSWRTHLVMEYCDMGTLQVRGAGRQDNALLYFVIKIFALVIKCGDGCCGPH